VFRRESRRALYVTAAALIKPKPEFHHADARSIPPADNAEGGRTGFAADTSPTFRKKIANSGITDRKFLTQNLLYFTRFYHSLPYLD